jgi:hypothetical protein
MQPVGTSAALQALARASLGPARIRLLPKENSLRPIVNLACPTHVRLPSSSPNTSHHSLSFPPVNRTLQPLHAALKCDVALSAQLRRELSASVASVSEAYGKLKAFAMSWRAAGRPRVVAVSFDVRKAFESVSVSCRFCCHPRASPPGWHVMHLHVYKKACVKAFSQNLPFFRQKCTPGKQLCVSASCH